MGLVTREEKGSKLTIQEMDGNLTYLDKIIAQDYTTSSVILTTFAVETIVKVLTIPANTLKNNDCLELALYGFTDTLGGLETRAYINSSNTLIEAKRIGNWYREGYIEGQPNLYGFPAILDQITIKNNKFLSYMQEFNVGDISNNSAIDLSVDNYIIYTLTPLQGLPLTATIEGILLKKIN